MRPSLAAWEWRLWLAGSLFGLVVTGTAGVIVGLAVLPHVCSALLAGGLP